MEPFTSLFSIVWLAVFFAFYMIPTIIATRRNLDTMNVIGAVNFFLGWTGIVWIVLLIVVLIPNPNARSA